MTRIEDYAMIGDCGTAALVGKDGCIDWLCLPNFDSPACFASLLGTRDNGHWKLTPMGPFTSSQTYWPSSLILETNFECEGGKLKILDFMTMGEENINVIRIVRGLEGETELEMSLNPRFEYGSRFPLIYRRDDKILIIKGPDQLVLRTYGAESSIDDHIVRSRVRVSAGSEHAFHLSYASSHGGIPSSVDPGDALERTNSFWTDWLESCHLDDNSPHPEAIRRSVMILKAMTCKRSGSIVAAVTTSLPEDIGSPRNWDYRFCWPRDAALAMRAVLNSTGQQEEIKAWRHWLIRATAGLPSQMEALYALDGTQSMFEIELDWLPGYEGSRPVRVGNNAREQIQLDIFASTIEVFYLAEKMHFSPMPECWDLTRSILKYLEKIWRNPDEGIWEVRGPKRHFVHSKVMVWAAFNLSIMAHDELGVEGPVEHWRKIREEIHRDICEKGFDQDLNSFTQYYGSREVDASLLRLPILGFLPVTDERIIGTVKKIEEDLLIEEGLVMRYLPNQEVEGLPMSGKRAFIICSAWLGEVYALSGDFSGARKIFEKLLSITNEVGLLSEQYDPVSKRQLGNFPQAFSHIALIHLEIALAKCRDQNPRMST